jgi:hypothetical protein
MPSQSWQQVLELLGDIQRAWLLEGSIPWFRGERDATWELRSTLHRHVRTLTKWMRPPMPMSDMVDLLRDEEKTVYRKFRSQRIRLHAA